MASTIGARAAAKIIMGMAHKIETDYGQKTEEGIADLIDRKTAAPELLEALEGMLVDYRSEGCADPACLVCKASNAAENAARAAIKAATEAAQGREEAPRKGD